MTVSRLVTALRTYGFGSQRLIPSLDGLRAVSIGFVLLAHLMGTHNFPITSSETPLGVFGVRVFFVISGFLITSILLHEIEGTGTVSLRRFYFRRALRLFPAAYGLILVVAVLGSRSVLSLDGGDVAAAMTYTMNFHRNHAWPLGHLWSLAVEEQFYLLWPLTLVAVGRPRSTKLLFAALLAAPLLRFTSLFFPSALFGFFIWSDALATGCLLALLRSQLAAHWLYGALLTRRGVLAAAVLAVTGAYVPSTKLQMLFGDSATNLAIAVCVDWSMRNAESPIGRFLNLPAVSFVGVLSYSLYLWQQLFLDRYSEAFYCRFPLNVLLAFVAALASYLLIEAPFLRLRMKIEKSLIARGGAFKPSRAALTGR